jgi:hypothetical protein
MFCSLIKAMPKDNATEVEKLVHPSASAPPSSLSLFRVYCDGAAAASSSSYDGGLRSGVGMRKKQTGRKVNESSLRPHFLSLSHDAQHATAIGFSFSALREPCDKMLYVLAKIFLCISNQQSSYDSSVYCFILPRTRFRVPRPRPSASSEIRDKKQLQRNKGVKRSSQQSAFSHS